MDVTCHVDEEEDDHGRTAEEDHQHKDGVEHVAQVVQPYLKVPYAIIRTLAGQAKAPLVVR
jgi:hypothetical protein